MSLARRAARVGPVTLLEIWNAAARLAVRGRIGDRQLPAFDGRMLPVDVAVLRRRAQRRYANTRDGLLAAVAREHGPTLPRAASRRSAPAE